MLAEVLRFHRAARRVLAGHAEVDDEVTFGEFLRRNRFSRYFVDTFAIPVVSAVWSSGPDLSMQYPARYLFAFLANHGLLSVGGSHQWKTVVGGSARYVERVVKGLSAVEVSTPVRADHPRRRGVRGARRRRRRAPLRPRRRRHARAHGAVPAVVPDGCPSASCWARSRTRPTRPGCTPTPRCCPTAPAARASWNLLRVPGEDRVLVSYDMTRLMRLDGPQTYVVTLNATDRVDPSTVIARMDYEHPAYTPASVAAQKRLPELNDGRIAFAGAYHGWGFHEDGCASGVRAAASLGVTW